MFSGIIEGTGIVAELAPEPPGMWITVRADDLAAGARLGDSIAVNGCCLTLVSRQDARLAFQAGAETLGRTNLGELSVGSPVNLERSLQVGDRLGGHFVSGHVDAVGTVAKRHDDESWSTIWFQVPSRLTRQMASKGCIAVDGVSLTLVDVVSEQFSVALIPHTLQLTTLGRLKIGDRVNIETDLLAKYVEQQIRAGYAF